MELEGTPGRSRLAAIPGVRQVMITLGLDCLLSECSCTYAALRQQTVDTACGIGDIIDAGRNHTHIGAT